MSNALFADISSYQTVSDWQAYAGWSRAGDAVARVVMRATEGVGFKDATFDSFWSGAQAAGIVIESIYHYARPDLNPGAAGAANEAQWFSSVIGNRIFQAPIMLDYEQQEDRAWAHAWHDAIQWPAGAPKPVLYDSVSHFNQFFAADLSLAAKFDCVLAAWYPLANGPPAIPAGWKCRWWQWTDNQPPRPIMSVPGVSMPVDVNLWLGGGTMVPVGPFTWPAVGHEIPSGTTMNQIAATFGLDWQADLLPLNSWAQGYNADLPVADGTLVKLPGYPVAAPPAQAKLVIDATSIRAVIV